MNVPSLTIRDLQPLLEQYKEIFSRLTNLLIAENKKYNLTRITDPQQIRLRHYLDSLIALPVLDQQAASSAVFSCIDIGSGAGFPVLPLAIVRPSWRFVSVEATGKKADFQRTACEALGLSNIQVVSARAEELAHDPAYREKFNAGLVRAVADLSILAELSLGLVKPGGNLLAWKGPDVKDELARGRNALKTMGGDDVETISYSLEAADAEKPACMSLVVVCKGRPTPEQYPRRFGQIKRHPL